MSTAPEIARLAFRDPSPAAVSAPLTIGALARKLQLLASAPERWWGLVRFHTARSERIDLDFPGTGFAAWLVVLAPGDPGHYCDCDLMMLVTGEAAEESVADGGSVTTDLRAGRARVHGHGRLHQIRATGAGFAVTLHVQGSA